MKKAPRRFGCSPEETGYAYRTKSCAGRSTNTGSFPPSRLYVSPNDASIETPEGSCDGAVAKNEIDDFAASEKAAVRGDDSAVAWAASSAAESADWLEGSAPPTTGVGGAVAPVSATRNAYWPRLGKSADNAPPAAACSPTAMTSHE